MRLHEEVDETDKAKPIQNKSSNPFDQQSSSLFASGLQAEIKTVSTDTFNQLRKLCKYKEDRNIDTIASLKKTLSRKEFVSLLHQKNNWGKGITIEGATIIQYAAKSDNDDAMYDLLGDLLPNERLDILQIPFATGCNVLHFTADLDENHKASYRAVKAIKNLLYTRDDHSLWLELLSKVQDDSETAVHYAARHPTAQFLQLFSDGLMSDEWLKIISIKNKSQNTAIHTYFLNMKLVPDCSHRDFIMALRGPLSDKHWVDFLLTNKIFSCLADRINSQSNEVKNELFKDCVRAMTWQLPQSYLNTLGILLKSPFSDPVNEEKFLSSPKSEMSISIPKRDHDKLLQEVEDEDNDSIKKEIRKESEKISDARLLVLRGILKQRPLTEKETDELLAGEFVKALEIN